MNTYMCTFIVFVITLCVAEAQKKETTVDGKVSGDKNGVRADFEVTHRRGNWEIRGGGHADSNGNKGFSVGLGFRFKKRSAQRTANHFTLLIEINPCNFNTYDRDGDGIIAQREMNFIFSDKKLAKKLFSALDNNKDEKITLDEFYNMAPWVISGCKPTYDVPFVL